MAVITTGSYSIDLAGVHTVRVKHSLWSYLPRIVSIITLAFSVFMAVLFGGMIFGSFPGTPSIWERVGAIALFLFFAAIASAVGYASMRILSSDGGDDNDQAVLKWAFGLSIAFCLMAAVFNYSSATSLANSGATLNQPWAHEMVSSAQSSAGMQIVAALVLMFAFWSLRLVDRKDVLLTRDSGVQKITNIDREDAIEIKNAARKAEQTA